MGSAVGMGFAVDSDMDYRVVVVVVAWRVVDRDFVDMDFVVGWYHSHPGFGCWLSSVDINTQVNIWKFIAIIRTVES